MLYLVGTSLGTVADTSLRAVETLCSCDVILCEDTRTFAPYYPALQQAYGLSPKVSQKFVSFHDHNEFERLPEVMAYLDKNLNVALVSEAGMPVVSDPGGQLVHLLIKKGYAYTVIPGPTALTTAMTYAGISGNTFFIGFLPKKDSQIRKTLRDYMSCIVRPLNLVMYESPHRLPATLSILNEIQPDAQVTICRELTKKFEEIIRGTPAELMTQTFKGEITLVVQLS